MEVPDLESTGDKTKRFDRLKYFQPTKRLRHYLMLEAISDSEGSHLTQRRISERSGISPSVVNHYLGEFRGSNLIERASLNQRDYSYSLTSGGRRKKREMLVEYIRETFQLFSAGKAELAEILRGYKLKYGIENLILYSAGEVTELLLHALQETSMQLLAIVDDDSVKQGKALFGYPIISREEIQRYRPDAVIITTFRYRPEIYEKIKDLEQEGVRIIGF